LRFVARRFGTPGINLFSSALVAIDAKTGAYKWHFQSVHHGQWDMDNTHNPTLADVTINGQLKKVIYYGASRQDVRARSHQRPAGLLSKRGRSPRTRDSLLADAPYPAAPRKPGFRTAWLTRIWLSIGSSAPRGPNYNGYQAS
jgi:hypothetical protein